MAVRLVFLAVCLLVVGCGRAPERGEVEGVVTLNGVPLSDVQVAFTSDGTGEGGTRATGFTDSAGKYQLRCDQGESGVPVGRYMAVVTDPRSFRLPGGGGKASKTRAPLSRVPARYTRFAESPLKAEIHAGPQTLNLELGATGGSEKVR